MKPQLAVADDFKLRRGLPRLWRWLDNAKVTVRERKNKSGGTGYRVTLPKGVTGGPVIFLQSRDLATAFELARAKGRDFRESRSTALMLSDANKVQAASAMRTLADHAVPSGLDQVVGDYCKAGEQLRVHNLSVLEGSKVLAEALAAAMPTGKPLLEVVKFAVERLCPEGGIKTLADVAKELIEIKRGWLASGGLRPASFHDFDSRAGKIRDEIGSYPLPDLTKKTIYDWLNGLDLSARSKRNYRMILSELLMYSVQKRFIKDNPIGELTSADIKTIEDRGGDAKQPAILSPGQAEKLLTVAFKRPELDLGAAVVLGLFAGIRTEELKRLSWSAVRLDETDPFVVIGPAIAKKRRIRNVPLCENALAWLRHWITITQPVVVAGGEKPVTRSTHQNDFQKRFQKLYTEAEIAWEANSMRHSFGTYHFSMHGNSMETSRMLGHKSNDSTLFDHYRALATKAQGEAYFAIYPKEDGVMIRFPAVRRT